MWGHRGPHSGPGRVPGLRPSLDRQAAGPGQHLVCGPDELQPHGIRGGRWIAATADPAPLQWPCGPIPPACPLLGSSRPALWRQTHLERKSWQKNSLRGSEGSASPVGRCPCTKGKFRPETDTRKGRMCGAGRKTIHVSGSACAEAGVGMGRTSHSPRDPPCPHRVLDSQPPDGGGTRFCC